MKIAIVPWSDQCLGNRMFENISKSEEVYKRVFIAEKRYFESRGHQYETIDQYHDWNEIDWILVYSGNLYRGYMREFWKRHLENKLIYLAVEPEVVVPLHQSNRMKKILRYSKYIATWNKEAVDGKRIFHVTVPYIMKMEYGDTPFNKRKLLTAIYSNKSGGGKKELYSERRKIFRYFEDKSEDFDLYGYGWSSKEFGNYKGEVQGKAKVYHKYRFAVALENVKDVQGGVTEKIFDCLCAGVVPIYYGALDIEEYVPKEAFIDYKKFKSVEEMYQYLKNIPGGGYIRAGKDYLCSKQVELVGVEHYCKLLENIILRNPARDIHCSMLKRKWYSFVFSNAFLVRGGRYIYRKSLNMFRK